MVLKDIQKGIAVLCSMAVLGFSVTGCGGGSSDGSSVSLLEKEGVVIDTSNSEDVVNTVFNVIDAGSNPTVPMAKSVGETSVPKSVLTQPATLKKIESSVLVRNEAVAGEVMYCTDGGSITPTDTGMIFSNCNESGMIMDGTVTVSGSETAPTMTLSNFTMTLDNETVFYESLSYSFTSNANYEITSMSITMDGYTTIFGERTEYQNYTFTMNMNDLNLISFSVNGFIKTDCLGGWIEIKTTQNIQINDIAYCPTAGQVVINGNASSITVDFNADGSVDLSGSVNDHYNSCSSIPGDTCSIL
jgi:hypothetical protein